MYAGETWLRTFNCKSFSIRSQAFFWNYLSIQAGVLQLLPVTPVQLRQLVVTVKETRDSSLRIGNFQLQQVDSLSLSLSTTATPTSLYDKTGGFLNCSL